MTEKSVSGTPVALVLAIVLIGAAVYKWWPSEERAIRRQLDAVADTLTVPDTDTDLARVARTTELRGYLAPDIQLNVEGQKEVVSRERLLGLAQSRPIPGGGLFVEFADVEVALRDDETAQVSLTARTWSNYGRPGARTIEEGKVNVGLAKLDGDWVITSLEPNDPPARQDSR